MKRIRILAVGRLKIPFWQEAAQHYHTRLVPLFRVEERLIRDAPAGRSAQERREAEARQLAGLPLPGEIRICLDPCGAMKASEEFAAFLQSLLESGRTPCFIVGGAFGLADSLKRQAEHLLSFGPMTLPHELARVVLLEQIYRAGSILSGTGYHH